MKRLNLNLTPEFERDLRRYLRLRRISRTSDAIHAALREAVARGFDTPVAGPDTGGYDYRAWLGMGLKAPRNKHRRFCSDDDLWP
jgi:hypothetical protein